MGEQQREGAGAAVDKGREIGHPSRRLSPRMGLLLIGGVALGGLACMCVLVAGLAFWRAG